MTYFITFCSKRYALAIDSTARPLIGSVTYFASTLEIRIVRAKKRKSATRPKNSIDPSLRIRYGNFCHSHKRELVVELQGRFPPLYYLATAIEPTPCAFKCVGCKCHATLFRAMEARAKAFPTDFNDDQIRITDSHDVVI